MTRPKSVRVTCWLHRPYRRRDGRLVHRIRYRLPLPDGGRALRQENVPQEVAWTARHRSRALVWMIERQAALNAYLHDPAGAVALREATDRYLAHMRPRWRRTTAIDTEGVLRQFTTHFGQDTPLAAVTGGAVADYLDGRLAGRASPAAPTLRPASYAKHLRVLRAFFGRLVKTFGYLDKNPCDGIEPPDAEPLPKPTLSDAECAGLVAEVVRQDRVQGLAVWTLAETGARVGEILTRQWQHLRRVETPGASPQTFIVLEARDTKAKQPRIPPILSPELTAELERYRAGLRLCGREAGYVFRPWVEIGPYRWAQHGPAWCRHQLTGFIRAACRALKLPEITPHAFRRTVATSAEELDVPAESVQEAVGWSGRAVMDAHYLAARALEHRALRHARTVSDARRFGARVAEASA